MNHPCIAICALLVFGCQISAKAQSHESLLPIGPPIASISELKATIGDDSRRVPRAAVQFGKRLTREIEQFGYEPLQPWTLDFGNSNDLTFWSALSMATAVSSPPLPTITRLRTQKQAKSILLIDEISFPQLKQSRAMHWVVVSCVTPISHDKFVVCSVFFSVDTISQEVLDTLSSDEN